MRKVCSRSFLRYSLKCHPISRIFSSLADHQPSLFYLFYSLFRLLCGSRWHTRHRNFLMENSASTTSSVDSDPLTHHVTLWADNKISVVARFHQLRSTRLEITNLANWAPLRRKWEVLAADSTEGARPDKLKGSFPFPQTKVFGPKWRASYLWPCTTWFNGGVLMPHSVLVNLCLFCLTWSYERCQWNRCPRWNRFFPVFFHFAIATAPKNAMVSFCSSHINHKKLLRNVQPNQIRKTEGNWILNSTMLGYRVDHWKHKRKLNVRPQWLHDSDETSTFKSGSCEANR